MFNAIVYCMIAAMPLSFAMACLHGFWEVFSNSDDPL